MTEVDTTNTVDHTISMIFQEVIPWILSILSWALLYHFCYGPLKLLNYATMMILFAALHAPAENSKLLEEFSTYDWFDWAKRVSLLIGWFALVSVDIWPKKLSPRIFSQFILFANVVEAAVLNIGDADYISGILLCLVSPFAPQVTVLTDGSPVWREETSLFGIKSIGQYKLNPLSPRWYTRLHLVILGSAYLFSEGFLSVQVFATLSCFIPLFVMEVMDRNVSSTLRILLIRAYALIWGTIIDSFAFTQYANWLDVNARDCCYTGDNLEEKCGSFKLFLMDNVVARNLFVSAAILLLLTAISIGDNYFPLKNNVENIEEAKSKFNNAVIIHQPIETEA